MGKQLTMRRANLDNLPAPAVPDGFTLRDYRDGDDAEWAGFVAEYCTAPFAEHMKSHRFYKPEKVKFICEGDRPVATATAWDDENDGSLGVVHMVGAAPEYRGRGLGSAVLIAVLHHMKHSGKTAAILTTDDHRLPAIKMYLRLGFEPVVTDAEQADRWGKIRENIKTT